MSPAPRARRPLSTSTVPSPGPDRAHSDATAITRASEGGPGIQSRSGASRRPTGHSSSGAESTTQAITAAATPPKSRQTLAPRSVMGNHWESL